VAFVLGSVVMGQAYGAVGAFLFLRLQQLGGSPLLMGLTLAVRSAARAYTRYTVNQCRRLAKSP
jgi:hypothetical protein